jgi:hypothetical protein
MGKRTGYFCPISTISEVKRQKSCLHSEIPFSNPLLEGEGKGEGEGCEQALIPTFSQREKEKISK